MIRSGFSYKLFLASGTGNGNFSLPSGHTDSLMTSRTVKIPIVTVLDSIQHQKISPVFLIAFVVVLGEAPEQSPYKQYIRAHCQYKIEPPHMHKQSDDAKDQAHCENQHIQTIMSISAGKEPTKCPAYADKALTEPGRKVSHRDHLVANKFMYLL